MQKKNEDKTNKILKFKKCTYFFSSKTELSLASDCFLHRTASEADVEGGVTDIVDIETDDDEGVDAETDDSDDGDGAAEELLLALLED